MTRTRFARLWLSLTFLAVFLAPSSAQAGISLGVGSSSVFTSRFVPVAELGWSSERFGIFGSSGGVRTSSSYYNAYELEFMRLWNPGDFWWGKITAGFGVGFFYAAEGYRPATGEIERSDDWTFGPAIRMNWRILKPLYIAVDGTFGLRNPFSFLALYTQDIVRFSIGIQL